VPDAVVPTKVAAAGGLTIVAHTGPDVADALKAVGRQSLVEQGHEWEVRQGDRLVGALELATLRSRADTRKEADRQAIRHVLPTEPAELDFSGVPVYEAKDGERTVFLWYGRQVLGVLQLRGQIDVDAVANELIIAMLQHDRWPGLPPDAFADAT
jgi:hypothetical protein